MSNYPLKYNLLLEEIGIKNETVNNKIYFVSNKVIQPFGPVKYDYKLTKDELKFLLNKYDNYLIRFYGGFNSVIKTDWYAVICDKFVEIENIKSENTRSKIRRGLKNNNVSKIQLNDNTITELFNVYCVAIDNYKGKIKKISKEEYFDKFRVYSKYDDLVEIWGVYHQNKLVGYSENILYDNIEVNYSVIKFNPEYLNKYISYALFYEMNKEYLINRRFSYVNDGFKNVLHITTIQDFLIHNFNFYKKSIPIFTEYNLRYKLIINILYPIRKIIKKYNSNINALYNIEEIKRRQF